MKLEKQIQKRHEQWFHTKGQQVGNENLATYKGTTSRKRKVGKSRTT
jgi:hypothetical protein